VKYKVTDRRDSTRSVIVLEHSEEAAAIRGADKLGLGSFGRKAQTAQRDDGGEEGAPMLFLVCGRGRNDRGDGLHELGSVYVEPA
jgi:hypothetical protein